MQPSTVSASIPSVWSAPPLIWLGGGLHRRCHELQGAVLSRHWLNHEELSSVVGSRNAVEVHADGRKWMDAGGPSSLPPVAHCGISASEAAAGRGTCSVPLALVVCSSICYSPIGLETMRASRCAAAALLLALLLCGGSAQAFRRGMLQAPGGNSMFPLFGRAQLTAEQASMGRMGCLIPLFVLSGREDGQ